MGKYLFVNDSNKICQTNFLPIFVAFISETAVDANGLQDSSISKKIEKKCQIAENGFEHVFIHFQMHNV